MDKNYEFYYEFFLNKFSLESQYVICIEEMSELIKELCKHSRYKNTDKKLAINKNIKEEIADVLNMVEELRYYFGYEEIENIRKNKLQKLYNKLNS